MPVEDASDCDFFFFNDTATTEIYTLSLHDALPIYSYDLHLLVDLHAPALYPARRHRAAPLRSEEHTSELQSRLHLVCRLLLEKITVEADLSEFVLYHAGIGRGDAQGSAEQVLAEAFGFFLMIRRPPTFTLFPYTGLFR